MPTLYRPKSWKLKIINNRNIFHSKASLLRLVKKRGRKIFQMIICDNFVDELNLSLGFGIT
jgi:hypothetical protein